MGHKRGCRGLLVVLMASVALDAQAIVDDLADLSIEQLLNIEVQSASKFRQAAIDAPAAVTVITADEIKNYGYRTLGEIIGSIRGIYTTYDRYFTYVGVRGFARTGDYNTRILLLIDGIRQNDAVFNQAMVGSESPLDVDLIERVEFVPGAGSSVYGSNAFFGVLNVITKNGGDFRGGEAAAALGSYRTAKGRLTYGNTDENGFEWLVSASSYHQHGQDLAFPALGGKAHDLDGDRSNSLFAKLTTRNLNASLMLGSRNKENPTASFGQVFDTQGSKSVDESAAVSLEYRDELSEKLSLSMRAHVQQYRYRGDFIYDSPARYINRDKTEGTMWGGDLQFTSNHFTGHRIVFGIEHRRDQDVRQRNFDVSPPVSYLDRTVRSDTTGIYLQDELAVAERWLLNVGVRHDQLSDAQGATSPRIGLIYKPLPGTALKLLYGEAYRSPNAYERYYETDTPSGYRTNPDLESEHIRSREFVVEHAISASQRAVVSFFHNHVRGLITQQYDAVADRFYFDNISSVKAKGVELEWTARFGGGVQTRIGASWQRAEDSLTGERIANSPLRLFKANLSAPFWNDKAIGAIEVLGMSNRKTWQGVSTPGFSLANLIVRLPRLTPDIELSAAVHNLFDRRYFDPVGEDINPLDRLEQNGRNLRFKLLYRF